MRRFISVDINNGRTMTLEQYKHDGGIEVTTGCGDVLDGRFTINPGDLVTMINWYRHQKDNGNADLAFNDDPIDELEEQAATYSNVRLAKMRHEIEMRVSEYGPDDDVMHGIKAAALQTDEFLDFAALQLSLYLDNFESDEVWHVIDDSIRIFVAERGML